MAYDASRQVLSAVAFGEEVAELLHSSPIPEIQRLGKTLGEWFEMEIPEREEVIRGLTKQEVGMVWAVTHAGKSTMLRNLSLSLACGRAFAPFTEGGRSIKVALIDSEDYSSNVQRDLKWMTKDFTKKEKLDVSENVLLICDAVLAGEELQLNRPGHLERTIDEIKEHGTEFIVVDTVSRCFAINNENDNSEIKERVMKPLSRLAVQADAGTLAAHHIGKSKLEEGSTQEGAHRGRGASSFGDQSRVIFNLDKDAINERVILSCPKIKGKKLDNCVFRLDDESRWFVLETQAKLETVYDKVLAYFDDDQAHTTGEVVTAFLERKISKRSVMDNLKSAVEFGEIEKLRHGLYRKSIVLNGLDESAESAEGIR